MPSRMCKNPSCTKRQRRLVPARIEPHQARIARELERALGAARRQEAQDRHDAEAEARERGRIENVERSDAIGYSNRTSSSAWFQTSVVSGRQRRPR